MFRVTKVIDFCYGHRLINYEGKCKNLHGHNGRLEIVLEAPRLDARGMVVDFSEIKGKIKRWVDDHWDHRLILNEADPGLAFLRNLDPAVTSMPANPTAENLARTLYDRVKAMGFPVAEVRLWETPASFASYSGSST
ncbi:MAG: 6-carboxytetrahydropterin synthase QueD [Elusimicrobia bacterium]|nr:6-carboxytetrahydropterin synthase QueD [Elusimicrobiota bacterium]